MGKILRRLGDLLQVVDVLDDLLALGLTIKQKEALIRDAPSGSIVPCGTLKMKLFGRRISMPLNPTVSD